MAAISDNSGTHGSLESRVELDSHANMPVVGRNAYIISNTGKTANVNPYNPDYEPMEIPIVDAALMYNDPFSGHDHVLIIRNALYVESMSNHLIPPFIIREAGIQVHDTPKIHVEDPGTDDHAITVNDHLRIPLSLSGTFSYFLVRKPTTQELNEAEEVYQITPDRFDPHNTVYAHNEDRMLDWKGEVHSQTDRKLLLANIPDVDDIANSIASLTSVEDNAIDSHLLDNAHETTKHAYNKIPRDCDQVGMVLTNVSPILDATEMLRRLEVRREVSSMMSSTGSCIPTSSKWIIDEGQDAHQERPSNLGVEYTDGIEIEEMMELEAKGKLDLDDTFVSATHAHAPSNDINASHLSKIWRIDHDTAERTLEITTHLARRTTDPKLVRNYNTNDRMLRYKRLNTYFFMDTFFATSKGGKSSRGHTCCQLFVTDKGYIHVIPMKTKNEVLQAVKQFAKAVGAPDAIVCDASGEQTSEGLKKFLHAIGTTLRLLEEGTPWANKAELYIGLIKEAVRKDMKSSDCPLAFWDYCVERRARINNLTAKNLFQLHGSNAYTELFHEQGDISNLCQFQFYEWCYARDHNAMFPHNREILGRVLGPATGEGNEMAQWVLRSNGTVVPRRTVRPLTLAECQSSTEIKKRHLFDQLIERRHGMTINGPKGPTNDVEDEFVPYEDPDEPARLIPDMEDTVDSEGRLLNQQPMYDTLINAEVQLHVGERLAPGKVISRVVGPNGEQLGTFDINPYLNTIMYEVEFDDGQIREYGANIIAESMITQVDSDGFSSPLMKGIIDYRKDEAVAIDKQDMYVITKSGQRRLRKTTQGWKLLIEWADGTESWIDLKTMKESHPTEVAEFAKAKGIDNEAAFAWWVPYVLRKRDVILSAIKTRVRKTTHKFGIEIPTSIEHAKRLDAANNNCLWMTALEKEMKNVGVAFELLPTGKQAPVGWKKVSGHLIWDVKMDFTRKARWVLDGHKTGDPIGSTYAGVVSRESIRIALTYAALNGLDVCAADIRNAFLQSPSSCKDYIICGAEFGLENVGKIALIHRALYGGKTAGRDFRNHLRACMRHLGFTSCPADADVWMRPGIKDDGAEYWEYILLYTDDALCVSTKPGEILRNELNKYFKLKEESIGPPKIYLGGNCRKVTLETGVTCWAFGSSQYVDTAVKNVMKYLRDRQQEGNARYRLPPRVTTPMTTSYRPELDVSPELNHSWAAYYQSLIGVLRWIVELGRVDVCLECSLMSSHLALPREGHLEQVLRIFGYLKSHHNAELVFDPTFPEIDMSQFERRDWTTSEFGHVDGREEMPPNQPTPRGAGFVITAKVDADHASNVVTRRSRTGFLVYINSALIYWLSKKQTSVESSSFGSEFCAMKQCCEYLRGLRYKLRMMGIPVLGPSYISGDNQSVLANTSVPESQLKKKAQSIAYHFVREGVARDEWRTAYISE